jgi:hypothetical protein
MPGFSKAALHKAAAQLDADAKTAVIVKGNPKYIRNNPTAARFYEDIAAHLQARGFAVSFDPGRPYTSPPPASLWIGHSRGSDRLRFAPPETRTIAMGAPHDPQALNHPDDHPQVGKRPSLAHYTFDDAMKQRVDDILAAASLLESPRQTK